MSYSALLAILVQYYMNDSGANCCMCNFMIMQQS